LSYYKSFLGCYGVRLSFYKMKPDLFGAFLNYYSAFLNYYSVFLNYYSVNLYFYGVKPTFCRAKFNISEEISCGAA
jgi:hypothetical protein